MRKPESSFLLGCRDTYCLSCIFYWDLNWNWVAQMKALHLKIGEHKYQFIGSLEELHKVAELLAGKLFESHIVTKERTVVAFKQISICKDK